MTFEEQIYQSAPAWLRSVLMNVHGLRIKRHRYGKPYTDRLNEFDRLVKAAKSEIHTYQEARLRVVLSSAARRSPWYRDRLTTAGISRPEEFVLGDLSKIAILTKTELREHLNDIVPASRDRAGWQRGNTSGTTGSPLSLWYDQGMCVATNAADRLQKRFARVSDVEPIGMLLGRQVTPARVVKPPFWHENRVQRQIWFSAMHMSPRNLDAYVEYIQRRRIRVMEGYPSTLFVLARHVIERGLQLPMIAVFSSSETLLPIQREAIETAFSTRLFDFYGHAERAIFAIECEQHQGKHLVEPFGITEIVGVDGKTVPDGEYGFLTGTSLWNLAMPMLRYRTGDVSAIDRSPCACGCSFPRIVGVSTKAEDIVVLSDGRWLSPSVLTHPFKPFSSIRKSQIIQETLETFTVRIVCDTSFSEVNAAELLVNLQVRLGPRAQISIVRVDDIPAERSGKFRWVISRVAHDLRVNWQ